MSGSASRRSRERRVRELYAERERRIEAWIDSLAEGMRAGVNREIELALMRGHDGSGVASSREVPEYILPEFHVGEMVRARLLYEVRPMNPAFYLGLGLA